METGDAAIGSGIERLIVDTSLAETEAATHAESS
jgi:hypothetical protein